MIKFSKNIYENKRIAIGIEANHLEPDSEVVCSFCSICYRVYIDIYVGILVLCKAFVRAKLGSGLVVLLCLCSKNTLNATNEVFV